MNYTKAEFLDLMEDAEDQGADHLDKICGPTTYKIGDKLKPVTFRNCGNSVKFDVPYESIIEDVTDSHVELCAVDDDMGRMPRFGGDRFGRDKTDA